MVRVVSFRDGTPALAQTRASRYDSRHVSRSRGWFPGLAFGPLLLLALAMSFTAISTGCKNRHRTGELFPPDDAPAWETRFAQTFDDDYTPEPLELQGRAPHDVLDQRLFTARLGYSHIVVLVRVDQVWGRGRYQGRKAQYIDIELGEVLLGEVPKGTRKDQLVTITGEEELRGDLQGRTMLLFVRWAPGERPPFHHHMMPATKDIVGYIRALVQHATKEGALGGGGKRKRKRRARAADGEEEPAPDGT